MRQANVVVVMVFGLLLIALMVGTLLETGRPPESTPTEWDAPSVASETPDPGLDDPEWLETLGTKPPWPTDHPTVTPGGPTVTPGLPELSTPEDWPTIPGATWEPSWTPAND